MSASAKDPRSPERLRHHFEVEKELGDQLRKSRREDRAALFMRLYPELFQRVPDHPRLTRRDTPEQSAASVESRMRLLRDVLGSDLTFLEFAPGDCHLAYAAAQHCRKSIGADISDQRNPEDQPPANFELVIYDGYNIQLPDQCADIAFSYQMLEHLHPEDLPLHFAMAHRLLKSGGLYIFDTPHRLSGPHDISRFFSDVPQGFHLKEYTYGELATLLRQAGFTKVFCLRRGKIRRHPLFFPFTRFAETVIRWLPKSLRKKIAGRFFLGVTMAGQKG